MQIVNTKQVVENGIELILKGTFPRQMNFSTIKAPKRFYLQSTFKIQLLYGKVLATNPVTK